jgi:hypothetical protein
MSWKASMLIIENKNNFSNNEHLLDVLGLTGFAYTEDTDLDSSLWPGDESISIGYYNDNIIVCDDCLILDDFISDQQTEREKLLTNLFPNSEILAVACTGTTNFHGYAFIKNGKKLRVKSLNADDGFYYDIGEPIEEEKSIYSKSEIINGKRFWKFDNLPGDLFAENQLMEEFTFGIAKRLLGVRMDHEESDFLMEEVIFKKYTRPLMHTVPLPDNFSMLGSWSGFFEYGSGYEEGIVGEKVKVMYLIDSYNDGEFTGKSTDVEGIGANLEEAELKGFIEGSFISFVLQYPYYYTFDENQNSIEDKTRPHPPVVYEGYYDIKTNSFKGEWELASASEPSGDEWICSGTWEMKRED